MNAPLLWQMPAPETAAVERLSEKVVVLEQRLAEIATRFPQAVFASSLAAEDMIITDVLAGLALPLRVVTLNTGKLNPETVALIDETRQRYGIAVEEFFPDAEAAAEFEAAFGAGAIYERVEWRKRCCAIRKIEPLNRALAGAPAWLTGQRRSQSVTRNELAFEEQDEARGIAKFNPIFDWEDDDVWAYVQTRQVPLNALYRQGYPSIGCEPCTRPVKLGENIRAGRWWWEQQDSKECGLHK